MPFQTPAEPISLCSFCIGPADANRDGEREELICCVECGQSGRSCICLANSNPKLYRTGIADSLVCIINNLLFVCL